METFSQSAGLAGGSVLLVDDTLAAIFAVVDLGQVVVGAAEERLVGERESSCRWKEYLVAKSALTWNNIQEKYFIFDENVIIQIKAMTLLNLLLIFIDKYTTHQCRSGKTEAHFVNKK